MENLPPPYASGVGNSRQRDGVFYGGREVGVGRGGDARVRWEVMVPIADGCLLPISRRYSSIVDLKNFRLVCKKWEQKITCPKVMGKVWPVVKGLSEKYPIAAWLAFVTRLFPNNDRIKFDAKSFAGFVRNLGRSNLREINLREITVTAKSGVAGALSQFNGTNLPNLEELCLGDVKIQAWSFPGIDTLRKLFLRKVQPGACVIIQQTLNQLNKLIVQKICNRGQVTIQDVQSLVYLEIMTMEVLSKLSIEGKCNLKHVRIHDLYNTLTLKGFKKMEVLKVGTVHPEGRVNVENLDQLRAIRVNTMCADTTFNVLSPLWKLEELSLGKLYRRVILTAKEIPNLKFLSFDEINVPLQTSLSEFLILEEVSLGVVKSDVQIRGKVSCKRVYIKEIADEAVVYFEDPSGIEKIVVRKEPTKEGINLNGHEVEIEYLERKPEY